MFNIEIENLKGKTLATMKGLTFRQAMHEIASQLDGASYVCKKTSLADLCLRVERYGVPGFYITLDSNENASLMNNELTNSNQPINL